MQRYWIIRCREDSRKIGCPAYQPSLLAISLSTLVMLVCLRNLLIKLIVLCSFSSRVILLVLNLFVTVLKLFKTHGLGYLKISFLIHIKDTSLKQTIDLSLYHIFLLDLICQGSEIILQFVIFCKFCLHHFFIPSRIFFVLYNLLLCSSSLGIFLHKEATCTIGYYIETKIKVLKNWIKSTDSDGSTYC